jgi:3-O-methylgallate 3,4-dioxygenase
MARITLAMAVPHSGLLGKPPETWLEDGERDRRNPDLWYRARRWTYAELEEARAHDGFAALLSVEERRARAERCAQALAEMRRVYEAHRPDVAVIIGKDQKEMFGEISPSFAIYTGAAIENGPPQRSMFAPDRPATYPAHPELARHLIRSLQRDGFDLADILRWPGNAWMQGQPIAPHAYGFVYHQIMGEVVPPNVPVFINTFFAPNQPSMARSIAFGKALVDAIAAWNSDQSVAVIASGGFSHFVCDEALDQTFIRHLGAFDYDALAAMDERNYQSGNSELKLYVPVLAAAEAMGAEMTLVDYVPCYRTPAGTGEGMGFLYWAPPEASPIRHQKEAALAT